MAPAKPVAERAEPVGAPVAVAVAAALDMDVVPSVPKSLTRSATVNRNGPPWATSYVFCGFCALLRQFPSSKTKIYLGSVKESCYLDRSDLNV